MKTIYLCTPHRLGDLNYRLIDKIERSGFKVLSAFTHTPQHAPPEKIFKRNIELIKTSDIFVAVLKDYGKDLAAETGMAYAWGKPTIGLDFNAQPHDIMVYNAFDKIVRLEQLEDALLRFSARD